MAVTANLYGKVYLSAFNKEVDLDTDTIKCMLCTSSHTPDPTSHQYKSSVNNEVTGTGYTEGGATLASKSITYDTGNNRVTFDCADISWANSTITARYAIFYVSTGTDGTSPLIGYINFGENKSSSNTEFKITIDSAGLFRVSIS